MQACERVRRRRVSTKERAINRKIFIILADVRRPNMGEVECATVGIFDIHTVKNIQVSLANRMSEKRFCFTIEKKTHNNMDMNSSECRQGAVNGTVCRHTNMFANMIFK